MKIKGFFFLGSLLLAAGCGESHITSSSTTGSTSNPAGPATNMTVSSPAAGASVSSPFQLSASATACQSQTVSTVGYSLDNATAVQVTGTALEAQVTAAAGAHTVHVLAWGSDGASCDTDVAVTVAAAPAPPPPSASSPSPVIPANAITVTEIQQLTDWHGVFDTATGSGSSSGVMTLVSSPSLSGSARQFETSFTNSAGERYSASFGSDPLATHFVYDAHVYVASPSDSIANIEMDLNQVTANGQTVIYGFQCDGYSSTWDITENAGTPAAPIAHWIKTSAPCNVKNWSTDTWHHVQVSFSRDDAGNVTYQSVWLDGVEQDINQTVPSSFALGWASVLLTNFQMDGRGASGSNTIYLDQLSVSRW